MNQRRTD